MESSRALQLWRLKASNEAALNLQILSLNLRRLPAGWQFRTALFGLPLAAPSDGSN